MPGHVHISRKAPSLFTVVQKNNCYRSTTLLFGLGWTIIIDIEIQSEHNVIINYYGNNDQHGQLETLSVSWTKLILNLIQRG